jgi:hypothetical protein
MEPSKGRLMTCPHCNMPKRRDYALEYTCGSYTRDAGVTRSPACYGNEITQLKAKVERIKAAGDKLAERHLLVPTTYPQAQAHVAEYQREKGEA